MLGHRSLALVLAGALGSLPLLAGPASAAAPTTPFVSEIHYDNAGADSGEFVEVQLPAGTSSAGLSVVLYNGSNGAVYDTDALPDVTASGDAPAAVTVQYNGTLQNGSPDGVALVRGAEVLEFLSYEGVMTATSGTASGMTSTDIGVAEAGTEPVGQSLSRTYDAASDRLVWAGPAAATPGQINPTSDPEPEPATCDATPTHEIGQVQGSGFSTPIAGQTVTVRGVVVGDEPGLGGFYLQDADGDGDPATSDSVFVAEPSADVDLGDEVAVEGTAQEGFGETQVAADAVDVCADGTAADLPQAASFDLPAAGAARERLEGMLVAPADTLTVSEVFALTRYGELTLSEGGLLVQPTEVARPGTPEAKAVAADNESRKVLLDDGSNASRSATNRPYLTPTTPVRVGDELDFREPLVLGYGFSEWRLQPADGTADGVIAPQNTRTSAPEPVGGDVQVGAFNVLNYFLTLGGVGRGATSAAQFEKQSSKIVRAIQTLDADVVTLLEIEDTDSTGYTPGNADSALADLVQRLNDDAGRQKWAYVPMPQELYGIDRDVIRNGIIYQRASVTPVGKPVGLVDESVWSNAREPIAQTFLADDDVFTVVANHLKSKSPGDPTGDNVDTGDGQGQWNGDRRRQAASLADFVDRLKAQTEDDDVIALGDFNAYSKEGPIEDLRRRGFTDLGETLDPGRYSYVYDELSGSLDHALATSSLAAKVTDLTHWNINSVESFAYQYAGDPALYAPNPFRSSDHDPLLLGLDLAAPVASDYRCGGTVPTILGTNSADVIQGTNKPDVIMALGGDDVVRGGNGDDIVCAGTGDDEVHGGNGDDTLFGGAGDDRLEGERGADRLVQEGGPTY